MVVLCIAVFFTNTVVAGQELAGFGSYGLGPHDSAPFLESIMYNNTKRHITIQVTPTNAKIDFNITSIENNKTAIVVFQNISSLNTVVTLDNGSYFLWFTNKENINETVNFAVDSSFPIDYTPYIIGVLLIGGGGFIILGVLYARTRKKEEFPYDRLKLK